MTTINKKRGHAFEESKEGYLGEFEERNDIILLLLTSKFIIIK